MTYEAAQEDRLDLSSHWGTEPLPRRSAPGEAPVLDPNGPKDVARFIGFNEDDARHVLAQHGTRAWAGAALRHLDGEPNPVGAGVVSAIVASRERNGQESLLRPEIDAWAAEHGLPFAVTATVVRLQLRAWRAYKATMRDATLRSLTLGELGSVRWELDRGIRVLRGLLAHASEAAYAAAAAAAPRNDPVERFLTTLLFPDESAWAEEVCREYKGNGDYSTDALLWLTIDRADLLTAAGLTRIGDWLINPETVGAVLRNLGADALPFLTASLQQQIGSRERHLLLDAIALLPSDDAAAHLVGRLGEEHMYQAAVAAAKRFPRRVLRTVAAAADSTVPELRPRLTALAADIPAAHRETLSAADQAAVEALLAPSPTPVADPALLPQLLTAPPWTVKGSKRKPKVMELSADASPAMAWAEGELDRWVKPDHDYFSRTSDADWERMLDKGHNNGSRTRYSTIVTFAPTSIALRALHKWDGSFNAYIAGDLKVIAARFGTAAASQLVAALRANPNHHEALVPLRSVEAARLAADWYARLKGARASAIAWFARHGGEGAALLIPDALGADKKRRGNAEGALWNIALRHGSEAVVRAAEPYGPEAAEAIAELLAGDPLEPRGVKLPKPDVWASPAMLPEVLTAAKTHALPADSVRHLITVLALSSPEYPYAGLDVVAEALDRGSLTRFSRGLFQLWLSMGAPSKDGWALTQLSHFADDDTVRLLAPLIREWPGQSQHKRAVTGLGVLGAIGSEAALRAIQGIAEKVKFKALKEEARVQIAAIAEGLGLTRDQLADRLLPDFGLGEEGALVLDYGPRRFTVVFDEQLKPFVKDDSGKPRKSLPKPGAKDDAEIADAAYKRFAALKKELRTVAADQVQRLEAAMVNGRTWTKDEFERYYVRHPLTWHLTRRLVWSAEAGGAVSGFRVAEDRTYTDADDEAFAIPDDAVIRLDHPVRLGDKAADWAELFADYEILQPFDQLSRPVLAFTPEESETGLLERFIGAKVEVGKLLGLTSRGWHRASPEDAGVEPGMYFPLPGGGYVTVALDPGIWVGMVAENPVQTLDMVRISATEDYWWNRTARAADRNHPRDIDPVTASEVLAALTRITAKD
ncbi:DUF4132 domain-containing protein [Glycomyces algeriensis]|uniref:MolR family transcriptional regulator n=1 Tax=Glycomyces algeriensis TaxID=256037 RepID=A0A9W6LH98_9ACTN|nr:DUF4132 domain-containing protein [Glycomyces algeriensis]MDA1364327.1 DUF4132 domain-containing protein [Glycomyces algeriensis]MDR7350360.1 hypothetical protein [Glycomyces algeriensis]GLI43065.1 MolR family transcriptional regulator [Glycomyces algeriensis]